MKKSKLYEVSFKSYCHFIKINAFITKTLTLDRKEIMGKLSRGIKKLSTIKFTHYDNIDIQFKSWPTRTDGKMYAVASLLVQFISPFIIFMVVYIKIYKKFRQSTNNITSAQNVRQSHIQRRRRTNILLFLISLMYLLSWAPINIFTIIKSNSQISQR